MLLDTGFRERAFDALVALASREGWPAPEAHGKCHGRHPELSRWVHDKAERIATVWRKLQPYRFALVMENADAPWYVTEKILNAFAAGAIPVYYGTEDVFRSAEFTSFRKEAMLF